MKKKDFNWKIHIPTCSFCGSKNVEEVWINFDDGKYSKHIEVCKNCGTLFSQQFENVEE